MQCGARHGRVDEETIAILKHFVEQYGWQCRPLKIVDGVAMSRNAMLPSSMQVRRSLTGTIINDAVICSGCSAKRANVAPITQQLLAAIAGHFGEPPEPIVFRRPNAGKRIKQQDAQPQAQAHSRRKKSLRRNH